MVLLMKKNKNNSIDKPNSKNTTIEQVNHMDKCLKIITSEFNKTKFLSELDIYFRSNIAYQNYYIYLYMIKILSSVICGTINSNSVDNLSYKYCSVLMNKITNKDESIYQDLEPFLTLLDIRLKNKNVLNAVNHILDKPNIYKILSE